jgi:hypothetical protein
MHAAVDCWRTHNLGHRRLTLATCELWHKVRRFEMKGAFCYWRTHVLQVLGSRLLCHKLGRQEMFVALAFGFWCMHLLGKRAQNTEDFVRQRARCRGLALCRELFRLWVIMTRTQRRVVHAACQWRVGGGHMGALVQAVFVGWRSQGLRSLRSRCAAEAQVMKRVCVSDTHRSKWSMCIIVILYFCTRRRHSHPGRYGVLSSPKRIVILGAQGARGPGGSGSFGFSRHTGF